MSTVSLQENAVANLRDAMQIAGVSQRELARASGVHYVTINKILAGKLEPSLATCERLAGALSIAADSLFRQPKKNRHNPLTKVSR